MFIVHKYPHNILINKVYILKSKKNLKTKFKTIDNHNPYISSILLNFDHIISDQ
jgi:hypothetical protein